MSEAVAGAPRRVQARGVATRERLLASARQLFGRDGYEGTSIVDVAREAGVGVGTVYHHFEDKRSLLIELLDREIASAEIQLVDAAGGPLARAFRAPDFQEALRGALRLVREVRGDHRSVYVIAIDMARRDPTVAERCEILEARYLDAARADLAVGREIGRIRLDIDLDGAAVTVYRSFEACIREIERAEDPAMAEAVQEELVQLLSRYLLAS